MQILSRMKLKEQGRWLILFPLVFEVIFLASFFVFLQFRDYQSNVAESQIEAYKPVNSIGQLYLESSICILLYAVSKRESFKEQFDKNQRRIEKEYKTLGRALKDQKSLNALSDKLTEISRRLFEISNMFLSEIQEGASLQNLDFLTDSSMRNQMMSLLVDLDSVLAELSAYQKRMDKKLKGSIEKTEAQLLSFMQAAIVSNVLVSVLLALLYWKGLVQSLEAVSSNCKKFAAGYDLSPALSGSNEIAQLDRAFHIMFAQLNEHRRRERGVVEEAEDLIFSVNESLQILSMNPAAERLWGWRKEELIGQTLSRFCQPGQAESMEKFFETLKRANGSESESDRAESMDGPERNISYLENEGQEANNHGSDDTLSQEFSMRTKAGTLLEMRLTIRGGAEKKTVYCVMRDISLEKETERLKASLVSMVTHDLRTPATSIQILLSLLESGAYGELEGENKSLVVKAKERCTQLISTINKFLDLEKIDSGSFNLRLTKVDLSSLLEHITSELEESSEFSGIEIEWHDYTRGANTTGDQALLSNCLSDLFQLLCRHASKEKLFLATLNENADKTGFELNLSGFALEDASQVLKSKFRDLVARSLEKQERFLDWMTLAHTTAVFMLHDFPCTPVQSNEEIRGLAISFKRSRGQV